MNEENKTFAVPEEDLPARDTTVPEGKPPVENTAAPEETVPAENPAVPEETVPVETPATPEETVPVENPAAPEETTPGDPETPPSQYYDWDVNRDTSPAPGFVPAASLPTPERDFTPPAAESGDIPAYPGSSVPEAPKKKKKKLPLLIAIICAVLVIVAGCIVGTVFLSGQSDTTDIPSPYFGRVDEDGTAYIPLAGGEVITINEDVAYAGFIPNCNSVVVMLTDGTLYLTDPELSEKTEIATDCHDVFSLRKDGFIYENNKGVLHRVLLSDLSVTELGKRKDIAVTIADDSISLIYADNDYIYSLPATEAEEFKLSKWSNAIRLKAVSNDGQIAVWCEKDRGDTGTLYISEGDETSKLGEVNYDDNDTHIAFSKDQLLCTVCDYSVDQLWIKARGEDAVTAKLDAPIDSSTIYTNAGMLSDVNAADVTALYVRIEGREHANLYHITMDGERERVISDIQNFDLVGNTAVYLDGDNTLYFATLEGDMLSDEMEIAHDVDLYELTENGKYVYYMKGCEDDAGSLYCCETGKNEPVRVAADVFCPFGILMVTEYSQDGATVYYFKDGEFADAICGTLMGWNARDEESFKIASDVAVFSVQSVHSDAIDSHDFLFMKYRSTDDYDNDIVNWMHYDGEESNKLATDVYSASTPDIPGSIYDDLTDDSDDSEEDTDGFKF